MISSIEQNTTMKNWPRSGVLLFVASEALQNLAYQFAKMLLIQTSTEEALWQAESHPDFKVIKPEQNRHIKVDQIRALNEWAYEKPSIATCKIAILHPADALNLQAANALLKTLEEPCPNTLFILITAYPGRVLATIRSRCHVIRHRGEGDDCRSDSKQHELALKQDVVSGFTALAQGNISPLKLAESLSKNEATAVLYWLVVYLNDWIKKKAVQHQPLENKQWWEFFDQVMQAKQSLDDKLPVNLLLLLETIAVKYFRLQKEALDDG